MKPQRQSTSHCWGRASAASGRKGGFRLLRSRPVPARPRLCIQPVRGDFGQAEPWDVSDRPLGESHGAREAAHSGPSGGFGAEARARPRAPSGLSEVAGARRSSAPRRPGLRGAGTGRGPAGPPHSRPALAGRSGSSDEGCSDSAVAVAEVSAGGAGSLRLPLLPMRLFSLRRLSPLCLPREGRPAVPSRPPLTLLPIPVPEPAARPSPSTPARVPPPARLVPGQPVPPAPRSHPLPALSSLSPFSSGCAELAGLGGACAGRKGRRSRGFSLRAGTSPGPRLQMREEASAPGVLALGWLP